MEIVRLRDLKLLNKSLGGRPAIKYYCIDLEKGWEAALHPRDGIGRFTFKSGALPPPKGETWHTAEKHKEGETYTTERKALHDKIVDSILKSAGEPQSQPIAILMGGGSASGKSTIRSGFVLPRLHEAGLKAGVVDSDEIKEHIPEYTTFKQEDANYSAFRVHDESSDIANYALHALISGKHNLIFDGTGANYKKYETMTEKLKNAGYKVMAVFADVPVKTAVQRSEERAKKTGRVVPADVIIDIHRRVPQTYERLKNVVDDYELYDNSLDGQSRLVDSKDTGVVNRKLHNRFLKKGRVR